MNVGIEWVIDATGCSPESLSNTRTLAGVFERIIAELGLSPVSPPVWHVFPDPGGVTGMVMLSESHLVCHTFPEHNIATFNLYCCKPRPEWPWAERLGRLLGAKAVDVRILERGACRVATETAERVLS